MSCCDHTQSGTHTSRRNGSGVAVVQKTAIRWQQGNTMINQPLGESTIFSLYLFGQFLKGIRVDGRMSRLRITHPIESPAKVDSGGA